MRMQYQLSNGAWVDCGDRTEQFLARCEKYNGIKPDGEIVAACVPSVRSPLTRDEVLAALSAGKSLRNDAADWYSNCRDLETVEYIRTERQAKQPPIEMVKCSCGHTVPRGSVMSASLGTSCPDCYDRMSA